MTPAEMPNLPWRARTLVVAEYGTVDLQHRAVLGGILSAVTIPVYPWPAVLSIFVEPEGSWESLPLSVRIAGQPLDEPRIIELGDVIPPSPDDPIRGLVTWTVPPLQLVRPGMLAFSLVDGSNENVVFRRSLNVRSMGQGGADG